MTEVNYLANRSGEPLKIEGIPAPVVNVSTAGKNDRQIALESAARLFEGCGGVDPEHVIDIALTFEYYLQHGEYPSG